MNKKNILKTDKDFDKLFPIKVQSISHIHWTPVEVAKKAATFLGQSDKDIVLDIGSGAGKFCIVGALSTPAKFVGVEHRTSMTDICQEIIDKLEITNIEILNKNIIDIDFENYTSFYFFNPFEENINDYCPQIDLSVGLSRKKYLDYTLYVYEELKKLPSKTRLATYCTQDHHVPECFKLESVDFDWDLKLWVKK